MVVIWWYDVPWRNTSSWDKIPDNQEVQSSRNDASDSTLIGHRTHYFPLKLFQNYLNFHISSCFPEGVWLAIIAWKPYNIMRLSYWQGHKPF